MNDNFCPYNHQPSSDTLALAMCDPGLMRRNSSECEEDSLPEFYMDSGLSTLRGSHGGYDSEQEVKGHEDEDEEEEEERGKKTVEDDRMMGENSDTEVRTRRNSVTSNMCLHIVCVGKNCPHVTPLQPAETQDTESAFGSDSSSVLDWKLPEITSDSKTSKPQTRALSAISVQVDI